VKTKLTVNDEDWKYVTYLVFDAPAHKGTYEERVEFLKTTIKASNASEIQLTEFLKSSLRKKQPTQLLLESRNVKVLPSSRKH